MSEPLTKDALFSPFDLTPDQTERANELADDMSQRQFNYRSAARTVIRLSDERDEALDKVIQLSIGNIDLRAENTRLRTRLREIEIANYGHSDEAQS